MRRASRRAAGWWATVAMLAAGLAGCRGERSPGPDVIASLGGDEIPYADFEEYLRRNAVEPEQGLEAAALSALLDQFLEESAIRRLALDRGLATATAPGEVALRAVLRSEAAGAVSAEEIRRFYDDQGSRFMLPERVRLRQILTQTRERANAAVAALAAGEAFAAVARRLSIEPAAVAGGDQGVLAREDLPPAFVGVVFSLAPGEVSEVVPADYGFHLFQVVEQYPEEVRPFPEVEAEIRDLLTSRRLAEARARLVLEARDQYNLRIYEGNLPFHYAPRRPGTPTPSRDSAEE
jgi:peptidyl-prolyl cis-trans isomerase C